MWWVLPVIYAAVMALDFAYRLYYNLKARARGCATSGRLCWYDFCFPFGTFKTLEATMVFARGDALKFSHQAYVDRNRLTLTNWFSGAWGIRTCNPDVIKAILSTSFKDFGLGSRHGMFAPLLGNSIFTLSGEPWKHSRAQLRPQFSRNQISHLESIKHHADLFIDRVLAESKTGTPDAQEILFSLTFDTSTEFLCGESAGTLQSYTAKTKSGPKSGTKSEVGVVTGDEFVEAFSHAQKFLVYRAIAGHKFFKYVDTCAFRENVSTCHRYIEPYIHKALENPMDKDETSGKYTFVRELTKETRDAEEIRDQAFSIMMAGRDTTAGTMSFLTCYLSKRPDVWARLKQEVLEQFGTDSSTITFESLKRCRYLSNVINETLRLNPIVPLNVRYATRDTVIPTGGGPNEDEPIFVPKGGIVLFSVYSMQRHERLWGPDAGTFNPDRWDSKTHTSRWDFLPFNGGPRICLGQQFALVEIACVFVRICQRVNSIETFVEGDPADLRQRLQITTSVDGGVPSRWT